MNTELQRTNRALRMISAVTRAAREEKEELIFFREVCRIITEVGGYRFAFVSYADKSDEKRVIPVAWNGDDCMVQWVNSVLITWDDSSTGQGVAGTAIRTGQLCVIRDPRKDPRYEAWKEMASKFAFNSLAGLPLVVDGEVEGALVIYAAGDSFGIEECGLLQELAGDVGYAMEALRAAERQKCTEEALRHSEESLGRAQQIARIGSWDWNPRRNSMWWSDQTYRLLGLSPHDVIPRVEVLTQLAHEEDRAALQRWFAELFAGEVSNARVKFRVSVEHDEIRHLELQAEAEFRETNLVRVVGVLQDISERVHFEEELATLARHDALTGLPNRALLHDRLEQALASARHARHSHHMLALAFIDLDRFKLINDSLGHDAGDTLLQEIAARLVACLRDGDTVARLGGDEFVVLLEDLARAEDATFVAQKMLEALAPPLVLSGREVIPAASIGIALYPKDGNTVQSLMMNADKAMYSAKQAGRNQYRFFDSDMNRLAEDWLDLSVGLHHALERGEYLLHYQPKFTAYDSVTGVEALLRWQHPEYGMVSPEKFVPMLEETGRIVEVGEWVIREACRQARHWRERGCPVDRVAVNLSLRQFQQRDLVERVRRILEEEGVPEGGLELELTESMVAHHIERAIGVMGALRELGVTLAIDDFGTGYSSLAALKRFPLDKLKIDRSFVQDLPGSRESAAIAQAVVLLAHSMGLTVIAEGVETEAQRRFLSDCGCDELQGFLLACPLPPDELEAMLATPRLRFNGRSVLL